MKQLEGHGFAGTPGRTRAVLEALLTDLAGWILIASLVYAPLAFGGNRPWALQDLELLWGAAITLFIAACSVRRAGPRVPAACLACAAFLLIQGWWMAANAHSVYDPVTHLVRPIASLWPAAPGSADAFVSRDMMLRLTGILGMLCIAGDLSRQPVWRRRFWWTIALTGSGVVILGLLQKARILDLTTRFMENGEGYPFATFNYHANAGAFINLVLPAVFGLAVLSMRMPRGAWQRLVCPALFLLCLIGAFVNVSRAAQVITLLLVAALGLLMPRNIGPAGSAYRRHLKPSAIALAALILLVGVAALGGTAAVKRWTTISKQLQEDSSRFLVWRVALPMASDAGAWGSGPGTFKVLFPHSPHMQPIVWSHWVVTDYVPGKRTSMWSNAHEDYLQTVVEWGWLGALAWSVLLFGGMVRLGMAAFDRTGKRPAEDRVLLRCSLIALIGISIHALMDFPLQIASLQLYTAVYLGLGWGCAAWPGKIAP